MNISRSHILDDITAHYKNGNLNCIQYIQQKNAKGTYSIFDLSIALKKHVLQVPHPRIGYIFLIYI